MAVTLFQKHFQSVCLQLNKQGPLHFSFTIAEIGASGFYERKRYYADFEGIAVLVHRTILTAPAYKVKLSPTSLTECGRLTTLWGYNPEMRGTKGAGP